MTDKELSALVGNRYENKRTGTVVTVRDITQAGDVWLSNGAVLPPDEFAAKWKAVSQ